MKTIDLLDFVNYECKDIYAWLLMQKETVFHIRMEKGFISDKDQFSMAYEYEEAILFGEKLSALSDDFGYYTASEYSQSPFAYDLITGNMEQLADTLFYTISVIADKPLSDEILEQYDNERIDFWEKYCNGEIKPVCRGLLYIMERILEKESSSKKRCGNTASKNFHTNSKKSKVHTIHTIDLFEFANYGLNDIYEYLLLQEETVFRIRMEKHFIAPEDQRSEIEAAYFNALYFGEKLSEFSDDFVYYTPSEYNKSAFTYELITADMLKLSNTLYYLIRGIILDESSVDIMEKYWDEIDAFWEKCCEGEIEPVCQGLLQIMEKNGEEEEL